jgi:hypothetical protein
VVVVVVVVVVVELVVVVCLIAGTLLLLLQVSGRGPRPERRYKGRHDIPRGRCWQGIQRR